MKLSVIIPTYNEEKTIEEIVRRVRAVPLDKELIAVNDASTDRSAAILDGLAAPDFTVLHHAKNQGKGAAIRTGLTAVTGDIVVIQDADLEYDPGEFPKLIDLIVKGHADVVYGSRFLGSHSAMFFWHYLGNRFLSLVTNVLYNTVITDMETCYKAFRAPVITGITIKANRFDFEPEITAKVLKQGCRVFEVPIVYVGRGFSEGKKITWRDGFSALWTLCKYRFLD
ncbi:MAG TPA: glycosyltransferase family 2 protein [bacterium]|nr:glycosyltransferase family 2 protein [bacterium]